MTEPKSVTIEQVKAFIKEVHYYNVGEALNVGPGHPTHCITRCVLVLQNNFTVSAESACVDLRKFDEDTGREIAYRNAVDKIWPYLGFQLATEMNGVSS